MQQKALVVLIAYLVIYLVWGSTYFFIRMAVATIPPFHVVGWRFAVAGVFFLVLALVSGRIKRLPTLRETFASAILGIFLLMGGNGLVTMAEKKVDSYLAALVIAATPLAVAVFDRLLLGKKHSLSGWLGILIGVAGVGLLLYNGKDIATSFSPGVLLVLLGLCSWSLATSLGHKIKVYPDSIVNSAIQMLTVGIISSVLAMLYQPVTPALVASFTTESIFALFYLAVIGSTGFIAYTWLIQNEPAIRVVSYAFVNPLIAILLGIAVGGEKPMPFMGLAIPLILIGLFLMLYGDIAFSKRKTFRADKKTAGESPAVDNNEIG